MKKLLLLATGIFLTISFHSEAQLRNDGNSLGPVTDCNSQSLLTNIPETGISISSVGCGMHLKDYSGRKVMVNHKPAAKGNNACYCGQQKTLKLVPPPLPLRYNYITDYSRQLKPNISRVSNNPAGLNYYDLSYTEMFKEFNAPADNGKGLAFSLTDNTSLNLDLQYCSGLNDVITDPADSNDDYDLDVSLSLSLTIR